MKSLQEENIKIKIAISLRSLLDKSKCNTQIKGKDDSIGDSHNTIALNAYIRKATVTKILNAKSNPKSTTLILIIEAMGFKWSDFSKIYDSLENGDIENFKKAKSSER